MATVVIVPGAWSGGWNWQRFAPQLRAEGHTVYTPTLTGLGERVHLASPDVGLHTHVQDVANVLVYEDLRRVVLVGHSYGGVVIPGVADRVPDRVAHLVYLDALVVRDGECQFDLRLPEDVSAMRERARAAGDGWRVPPPAPPAYLGLGTAEDLRFQTERRVPQPLKTFEEPVRFRNPAALALPRTYIHCVNPARPDASRSLERVRGEPGWRYLELPTGHLPHITAPDLLIDLLCDVAREHER